MKHKQLDELTISDLEELIENAVPEGKTIDYKESLSISKDGDKKEFLYDICSFANSSGGDLLIGIKEDKETGYPCEISGITIENTDKLQLQLGSIIRESISPRLPSVKFHFLKLEDDRYVLVIRIAKSWNRPHQVTYKGSDKFYSRSSNGKYKLDVFELKNAFNASESLKQNSSNFKNGRVADIIANEGAAALLDNGKIIFHIIPFASFETGAFINLKDLHNKRDLLRPIGEQGYITRYNFDGILSYVNNGRGEPNHSYLQVFKSGIIETVDSWVIQPFQEGKKHLYIESIEEFVMEFIRRVPQIYDLVNIAPPFVLLLTMTGTYDYQLGLHNRFYSPIEEKKVGKDILNFPDLLIEDWEDIDMKIKPWFDSLWNAVGFEESKNFGDGKWIKSR